MCVFVWIQGEGKRERNADMTGTTVVLLDNRANNWKNSNGTVSTKNAVFYIQKYMGKKCKEKGLHI